MTNPYRPPDSDGRARPSHVRPPNGWVPCPKCGSGNLKMPSFTWWGGAIGQKLLSHVGCQDCGTHYNAKTGASNTAAIVLYQVVIGAILLGIFLFVLRG